MQAKRSFEALHAFIDAYERILAGDDFRSDLDPEVTDDISESVKSAHELLVLLRESAPVAAGVLTALMATKVILNESLAKIEHLCVQRWCKLCHVVLCCRVSYQALPVLA